MPWFRWEGLCFASIVETFAQYLAQYGRSFALPSYSLQMAQEDRTCCISCWWIFLVCLLCLYIPEHCCSGPLCSLQSFVPHLYVLLPFWALQPGISIWLLCLSAAQKVTWNSPVSSLPLLKVHGSWWGHSEPPSSNSAYIHFWVVSWRPQQPRHVRAILPSRKPHSVQMNVDIHLTQRHTVWVWHQQFPFSTCMTLNRWLSYSVSLFPNLFFYILKLITGLKLIPNFVLLQALYELLFVKYSALCGVKW